MAANNLPEYPCEAAVTTREQAMPVPRKQQVRSEKDGEGLGLMANGSSGEWTIAVDEATKGPDRWFVQLEGSSVYFSFEIPSPAMVSQALDFLEGRSAPEATQSDFSSANESLVFGKYRQTPVILIRDDEYKDRFFLGMGQVDDLAMRFTIAGQDLKDIKEVLRQAMEDIEDEI